MLLNGRRLSNYAFLSGTVDLSAIPLAAIERVEILKDGASSIYGTDAIAGVVNFITRKDFAGAEITGQAGVTEHGGGDHYQATVTAGWGDLTKDRFNAFVTLDWQKDTALVANQRPFASTGYLPDEGINLLTRPTFPANIRKPDGTSVNPSRASGCAPPDALVGREHAGMLVRRLGAGGPACRIRSCGTGSVVPPGSGRRGTSSSPSTCSRATTWNCGPRRRH